MVAKSRRPQAPDPNQGAFIEAEVTGSGTTDAATYHQIGHIVGVSPEGFFPDDVPPSNDTFTPEAAAVALIAERTKTANRRRAQVGKHSPLQRDGTYLTLLPGDVLPPDDKLGIHKPLIVTETNFKLAKHYASQLEAKRLRLIADNPTLDRVRVSDVVQVVADGLDLNSALEAAKHIQKPAKADEPSEELPRFNTLRSRLGVIIDEAQQANIVPGSRTEITVALPHLDKVANRASSPSVLSHSHLMETYDATKKVVRRKGYTKPVQEWYADRAVASRCYELVDFHEDAMLSLAMLEDFKQLLNSVEGDEAKREIIAGQYHPAMGVVVRHIVAHQLKDGELTEEDLFFKPMTASVHRTSTTAVLPTAHTKVGGQQISAGELAEAKRMIEEQVRRGTGEYTTEAKLRRNKTLVTPFTDPEMPESIQEFIHRTFADMSLVELRAVFPAVVQKQENREHLWADALEGIKGKYKAIVASTVQ